MRQYGTPYERFVRAYAVTAVLVLLMLVPAAVVRIGTMRSGPANVRFGLHGASVTASAVGTTIALDIVSMDGSAAIAADGVSFLRHAQSLPAGTSLRYVGRDRRGASVVIAGAVRNVAAPRQRVVQHAISLIIASTFAIFGFGLALTAADARARLSAAALCGIALMFAPVLLEPTASAIASHRLRAAVLVGWAIFPRQLALYFLPAFVAAFPQPLPREGGVRRVLLFATLTAAVALYALTALLQIPDICDRLTLPVQRMLIATEFQLQHVAYALSLIATLAALVTQWRRRHTRTRTDLRRLTIVTNAFVAGIGVPLSLAVLQIAWIVITRRQLLSSSAMTCTFASMLVIAPAVTYAARARRVDSVRLMVQRAALFTFARRTIQLASLLPVVVLVLLFYWHRATPIAILASAHPLLIGGASAVAVLSLRFADTLHVRLEQLFFRERADTRRILGGLADSTRRIDRIDDLSHLLEREIERALHPDSISLFVRERSGSRFRARGVPWFLESFSAVIELLGKTGDFFDIDREQPRLQQLSEIERLWLSEANVRMLVPLRGGEGALIAFLALGEKRSELPYDREDRLLLRSIATSTALALENHILRSSPSDVVRANDAAVEDIVAPVRYCASCRAVTDEDGERCPIDDGTLIEGDIPRIISGKYRIDAYLGAGGMGVVFRARDLTLGRAVAIKTLPRLSTEAAIRFRRESRLGAALTHPALAAVFAAETVGGRPLLVMEYLGSGTLASRLADSPLEIADVVDCAVSIGEALIALHEAGVLHRDVKPSNIGFASDRRPKLLDFGLARLLSDSTLVPASDAGASDDALTTRSTGVIGTPAYLPPEVIVGRTYGPAVDLWGLSMSLYEALTGVHPLRDATPLRTMNRIVSEDVPDARVYRADCPLAAADVLRRGLSRDAARRMPDARSFTQAWRDVGATAGRSAAAV
jgi:hypothetical protein